MSSNSCTESTHDALQPSSINANSISTPLPPVPPAPLQSQTTQPAPNSALSVTGSVLFLTRDSTVDEHTLPHHSHSVSIDYSDGLVVVEGSTYTVSSTSSFPPKMLTETSTSKSRTTTYMTPTPGFTNSAPRPASPPSTISASISSSASGYPTMSMSHSGHLSYSDFGTTLITEQATTCSANGETCLCHDGICIGGLQTSATIATSPTTVPGLASTAAARSSTPLAAIIIPTAISGFIVLLLILPCCLRHTSPAASAKFNRFCPLDDTYRGIAAIWARLKLTRHRNRDVRKRTTSGSSYVVSSPVRGGIAEKDYEHPPDASVSSATLIDEHSSYLGKWRFEQERNLQEAKQRQLRENRWGGTTQQFDEEVERARELELRRVRDERRMGAWLGGMRGSRGQLS